jgi:hypothetical protein
LSSAAILGLHSPAYLAFAVLQLGFWLLAAASLKVTVPVLQRLTAPAGALLVLNAAAIAGFFAFLFTRGPLWKIWSPTASPMFQEQV